MKNITKCLILALLVGLPITGFRSPLKVESKQTTKQIIISKEKVEDFLEVGLTYYNPVISQCDSDPLVTASMHVIDTNRVTELHWCAISFDMHVRYGGFLNFGDIISLEYTRGNKTIVAKYIVRDLMNPTLRKRVDILCAVGDHGIPRKNVKLKHPKLTEYNKRVTEAKRTKELEKALKERINISEEIGIERHLELQSDFYYKGA